MQTGQHQAETPQQLDMNECVRRLRALARKYEDFFQAQFSRLQQFVRDQEKLAAQAEAAQRMIDNSTEQRQVWEAERDLEFARISEASEKLIVAWEQLEKQQRQLLLQEPRGSAEEVNAKQPTGVEFAGALSSTAPPSSASMDWTPATHAQPFTNQPLTNQPITSDPLVTQPPPSRAPISQESETTPASGEQTNAFEYEQLRRQMRQHSKRKR